MSSLKVLSYWNLNGTLFISLSFNSSLKVLSYWNLNVKNKRIEFKMEVA